MGSISFLMSSDAVQSNSPLICLFSTSGRPLSTYFTIREVWVNTSLLRDSVITKRVTNKLALFPSSEPWYRVPHAPAGKTPDTRDTGKTPERTVTFELKSIYCGNCILIFNNENLAVAYRMGNQVNLSPRSGSDT